MPKKQNKGSRVWLPAETTRILDVTRDKLGFSEGEEAAVILVACSQMLFKLLNPSLETPVNFKPDFKTNQIEMEAETEDEEYLDIDFDID